MRKTGCALAVVLVLVSTSSGRAQSTQLPAPPQVDYDAFMELEHAQRLRAFDRLTPEQRADVMLIHLSRWMAVNMNHLTQEQRRALTDLANVVAPPMFRLPGGYKYTPAWRDEVASRIERLFSPAQIRQALTIYGDYIPEPWTPPGTP